MDFSENDDLHQLRDTLRRFVEKEMPRSAAAQWDKDNHFPRGVFDKLAGLGVLGLTVPEEYGGLGRDIPGAMMVIEELSRRSQAVAIPYIMGACYAAMNLVECATEEQKQRWLPQVVEGKLLFAYGWTEPDVGADLASVRTRAERHGDVIRINGSKRFCTGAEIADYIYTLVRSGPEQERYSNLSLVMVPRESKGVVIDSIDALGVKGSGTTDITFTDVEVPVEYLMGGEAGWNQGWKMIIGAGLDVEKLEVAAIGLGIACAALEDAWTYAYEREQFGKTISNYQSIQHKLADMKTQVHASRLMLQHAAWMANRHQRCSVETSMTKLFVTETCKQVTLEAMNILGAYGYVKGMDVERYVRDALVLPIFGGSSAIQRNNIFKWSGKTP